MFPRTLWFAAGVGAGVYGVVRTRRLAESLTADGLRDRWNGVTVGWRMFTDTVVNESRAHEAELRERYGLVPHGLPELTSGHQMSRKREIN